jgi:hypothetical protein
MRRRGDKPSRPTRAATLAVLSLGALLASAQLDTSVSPAVASRSASDARTIPLNENGDLRLTSRRGFTLNEQGRASGTVAGTIYVHLKIVSTRRVTAEVNIYPKGGSISGYGSASYRRQGATGYFSGTLSINRGSGSYNNDAPIDGLPEQR